MEIELPFPPSVNHYWRRVGPRTLISKEGRAFRDHVQQLCTMAQANPQKGPLGLRIEACPPDRRRRDLDNLLKAPLDAMQAAGLYEDDYQIEEIHLHRGECTPGGKLIVSLWPKEGLQSSDTSDMREQLSRKAKELQDELASVLEALASISN